VENTVVPEQRPWLKYGILTAKVAHELRRWLGVQGLSQRQARSLLRLGEMMLDKRLWNPIGVIDRLCLESPPSDMYREGSTRSIARVE